MLRSTEMSGTQEESISDRNNRDGDPFPINYFASLLVVLPFLHQQASKLIAAIVLSTLSVALELVPIYAIYRVLEYSLSSSLTWSLVFFYTVLALISMIGAYVLIGVATTLSHVVAFQALYQLRLKIAQHLASLPMGYFSRKRTGEAKKLLIDDPEKLELIVAHGIPEGMSALATWVAVSGWLIYVDWRMAIASIIITPVSFVLLITSMKKGGSHSPLYQRAGQRMNASIVEYLNGLPEIKIFNRANSRYKETEKAIKAFTDVEIKWATAVLPLGGSFFSLVLSNIVFIVSFGAMLITYGVLDVGTFTFFVIVGSNYSRPLLKLFHLFHELAHISISSEATAKVLATPSQPNSKQELPLNHYDIQFDQVSFGYDSNNHVLDNINFIAKQNTTTALVGPSGAGKSTIATLIPRFYDVTAGRITIGGIDIRDLSIEQLMDTVAFVFQDTYLFTGTIEENLRFGSLDASFEKITQAAEAAQLHSWILSLPDGYQTKIGDKGRKLSGGEKQRLTIARAILKDAPIVILDEATAFTDPDNEAAIQHAIESLTINKTVIIIAHRLNTIKNVDQIVVIDKGTVSGLGTHTELVTENPVYRTLWEDFIALQQTHANATVIHSQGQ
ncbi:ABC transporter ATP-binding protein [Vibrio mimicus]|nr:ABC transporter ATP-binding protein [Vibrio mimicus]